VKEGQVAKVGNCLCVIEVDEEASGDPTDVLRSESPMRAQPRAPRFCHKRPGGTRPVFSEPQIPSEKRSEALRWHPNILTYLARNRPCRRRVSSPRPRTCLPCPQRPVRNLAQNYDVDICVVFSRKWEQWTRLARRYGTLPTE
jgi:hypothetical protein